MRALSTLGVLLLGFGAAGCLREAKPLGAVISELRSPTPALRAGAAGDLRTEYGIPPEAIQPLLAAIATERNPDAYGAMLLTLGLSGVLEAKPLIDANLPMMDRQVRSRAARALTFWMIANRQLPPEPKLPAGWPYGQPGYPPPLPPGWP